VPLLVHRFARERLQALAQAQGEIEKAQPEVLFVCVHNAGRSQIGGGPPSISAPAVESTSARQAPTGSLDQPRRSRWAAATRARSIPARSTEDWEVDDPAEQDLEAVRKIRDEIDRRVQALMAELLPGG
jgi:arsenate reductase